MFDVDKISDFEAALPGGPALPGNTPWQVAIETNVIKEDYAAAQSVVDASMNAFSDSEMGQAATLHALAKLLHAQGNNDDARIRAEAALSKFRKEGDKGGEAIVLNTLARLDMDKNIKDEDDRTENLDKVEESLKEALSLFLIAGSRGGQATVTVTLAKAHFMRGRFDDAIESADKAFKLFDEDKSGQAAALLTKSMVNLFWGSGKWDAAASAAKEAIALCKQVDTDAARMREADAWLMICASYVPMSKGDEAVAAAKSALEIMQGLGGDQKQALALRALAFAQVQVGSVDEALGHFQRASDVTQTSQDKNLKATLMITGAVAHRIKIFSAKNRGKPMPPDSMGKAWELAEQAVNAFTELGDEASSAMARIEWAQAQITMGSVSEGIASANTAKDFFESRGDKAGEAISLLTMADGLNAQGDLETAYGMAKRSQELFNQVGGAGEGSKAAAELLEALDAQLQQKREKGQWGAIEAGTFMGDFAGFGGAISRANYTKLFTQTLHWPDRPYEVMLDAPMFQNLEAAMTSIARAGVAKPEPSRKKAEGGREGPSRPEGQPLRQVPLKEPARPEPSVVTPTVLGSDALGGRTWDCPESVHNRMLELASRGDIPLSKPEQRMRNQNKRPTFYGAPEWRDAVKMGYVHPEMNPPRGMKWRKVTMGWKLMDI